MLFGKKITQTAPSHPTLYPLAPLADSTVEGLDCVHLRHIGGLLRTAFRAEHAQLPRTLYFITMAVMMVMAVMTVMAVMAVMAVMFNWSVRRMAPYGLIGFVSLSSFLFLP